MNSKNLKKKKRNEELMAFDYKEFLLIVIALGLITSSWFLMSSHFVNCHMDRGKSDWNTNCINYGLYQKGKLSGVYNDFVYPLYPFKEFIIFYSAFLLPLLLFYYGKVSRANPYLVLFLYFVSLAPLAYVIKSYMKQLLFDNLMVLFLIFYYRVRGNGWFVRLSSIAGFLILGSPLSHGYRNLKHPIGFYPAELWHNIPFTAIAGVYFAFIGFTEMVMEKEFLLFALAVPLAVIGAGDSRAYSTLFFFQLPFIARFLEKRFKEFRRNFKWKAVI